MSMPLLHYKIFLPSDQSSFNFKKYLHCHSKEHDHAIKLVLFLWHFCHINHTRIWEILFSKTASPQENLFSFFLFEGVSTTLNIFLYKTDINGCSFNHAQSKSSMITFLLGCQVLFFPGLPSFLSFVSILMHFTAVTDTAHYTTLLSSTQQIGEIILFYIASW